MSHIIAFRVFLAAVWLVPLTIQRVDLVRYLPRPHATTLVAGPPVTATWLLLEQWVALGGG